MDSKIYHVTFLKLLGKISTIQTSRAVLIALISLSALIPMWVVFNGTQLVTGDETRYLFYAISLWERHTPVLTQTDYNLVLAHLGEAAKGMPNYNVVLLPKPLHSVVYPIIMSGAVGQFGVLGGRLVTLIFGLSGLVGLFLCLRYISDTNAQAFWFSLLTAITLPTLPYLSLALPEIVLFSGTAWALYLFRNSNFRSSILIALLLVTMAFIHLRALGLIVGFSILFIARQIDEHGYETRWTVWRNIIYFVLILAIGLILLSVFNVYIYGHVLGSVTTARPIFSDRGIAAALIGAQHGLLTYAPIWILAIVGLILGCLRGDIWAVRSSILISFLIVGFIGPNAGACWPARFWVITIPALTIGLILAWRYSSYAGRVLFVILILVSLLNTLTYIFYPSMYLENRQISRVYDYWYEKIPVFYFGIALIINGQPWQGQAFLLLILIGAATQSITQTHLYMRWTFAILFLIGFLGTALVESVDYEISDQGNDRTDIQFKHALIADGTFLLGFYKPYWYFSPQIGIRVNETTIPVAPALLLDLYGRPKLTLNLPPKINNLRQFPIVLLRTRAPWVRWFGMGNRVWKP